MYPNKSANGANSNVPTVDTTETRQELLSDVSDEVIERLSTYALDDPDVLSLLAALAKRVVERNALLEETGMSLHELNKAWRRLGRMVRELPAHLRDQALAALS